MKDDGSWELSVYILILDLKNVVMPMKGDESHVCEDIRVVISEFEFELTLLDFFLIMQDEFSCFLGRFLIFSLC